jgi:hypothetical protein
MVPADIVMAHLSDGDKKLLQSIGITAAGVFEKVSADTQVNYDRIRFYNEVTKAVEHWMVGPALELYADYATNYSQLHGSSVWITSENPKYQKELTKLLDRIGVEEKIFDWAWTTAAYGDLFIKINGEPELGIVSIDDDDHPMNTSRIDDQGSLIGFYNSPQGQAMAPQKIMPPWQYVHMRLLGAKRKRPQFGDPQYSEFRTMHLMGGTDTKQVSSRYGCSIIINALPVYKRLRLSEDSLLMARLTRGIIRYIWKLKVDSTNAESTNELMTQLVGMLKKARAFDTSAGSPNFDSKFGPLSAVEDLLIPVWGDVGDLAYDKIGGDADIHWITDIQELRNQLSCALRVPLSVLGGFTDEASGALGSQAIEKLSIEFAHAARRLQRAIKVGIKRMCQIHLAWMNLDPDPRLFEVNMTETSTAEEESIKNTLDTGIDVIVKFMEAAEATDPNVDKKAIFTYLNQKILKLEDFDINDFLMTKGAEPLPMVEEAKKVVEDIYVPVGHTDLMAFLPIKKDAPVCKLLTECRQVVWDDLYGDTKVKEVEAGAKIVETKDE